jgi:hypothetical protein
MKKTKHKSPVNIRGNSTSDSPFNSSSKTTMRSLEFDLANRIIKYMQEEEKF